MKHEAKLAQALFRIQTIDETSARTYLSEWIPETFELSQLVRKQTENKVGSFTTFVPVDTTLERAHKLYQWYDRDFYPFGKYSKDINPVEDCFIIPHIVDFLNESVEHVLVCREPTYRKDNNEYCSYSRYENDVLLTFHEQSIYYVVSPILGVQDLEAAVKYAIDESDGFKQMLMLSRFDVRAAQKRGELTSAELKEIADNVNSAMVQVYDFEGWLLWQRG